MAATDIQFPLSSANAARWTADEITIAVFWAIETLSPGSSEGLQGIDARTDGITQQLWLATADAGHGQDEQDRFPTKNDYDRQVALRVGQAILLSTWYAEDVEVPS